MLGPVRSSTWPRTPRPRPSPNATRPSQSSSTLTSSVHPKHGLRPTLGSGPFNGRTRVSSPHPPLEGSFAFTSTHMLTRPRPLPTTSSVGPGNEGHLRRSRRGRVGHEDGHRRTEAKEPRTGPSRPTATHSDRDRTPASSLITASSRLSLVSAAGDVHAPGGGEEAGRPAASRSAKGRHLDQHRRHHALGPKGSLLRTEGTQERLAHDPHQVCARHVTRRRTLVPGQPSAPSKADAIDFSDQSLLHLSYRPPYLQLPT